MRGLLHFLFAHVGARSVFAMYKRARLMPMLCIYTCSHSLLSIVPFCCRRSTGATPTRNQQRHRVDTTHHTFDAQEGVCTAIILPRPFHMEETWTLYSNMTIHVECVALTNCDVVMVDLFQVRLGLDKFEKSGACYPPPIPPGQPWGLLWAQR